MLMPQTKVVLLGRLHVGLVEGNKIYAIPTLFQKNTVKQTLFVEGRNNENPQHQSQY